MLSIANNKEGPGVLKTAVAEVKRQAHTRERRSVSDEETVWLCFATAQLPA
jgi:hypothetical protein